IVGFDYSLTEDQINSMSLQELEILVQRSFHSKTSNPAALIDKQQYSIEDGVTSFDLTRINKGLCDARLENGYLVLYANSEEIFCFNKCIDTMTFII
ncbi:MAG: hypothetical protein J5800_06885, partial [Spirochaetales bacterium]|nr:hypothetical protein [Spirochaetales bacterium]